MNKDQKAIAKSFILPLVFVIILWLIKLIEIEFNFNFSIYGVLPRHANGLIGVLTSPLIHGDFEHLISNSIPFLILGAVLIYFYKEVALKVFVLIYLLSGFWLWLGGRENYHIGASGVVYGLITFLFLSGILRKHTGLMALSLLVVFLYGGLVWGIFPLFKLISWEAHLFGSLAGILCAVVFRKEGPQRLVYEWENEDENEIEISETEITPEEKENIHINYIYKKEKRENDKGELSN